MIFFEIIKNNDTVLSNIKSHSRQEFLNSSTVRNISRSINGFKINLFGTDYDYKLLANKHIADKTAEAYLNIISVKDDLRNEYGQEYAILSHNLITSHSLLQDAVWRIIPEVSLVDAENHSSQIDIVKKLLEANQQKSAESILAIVKRVVDLQAQIEGFKILSGNVHLDFGNHNIKKVLQNIIYPFYEDFRKNNINIRWYIDYDKSEINPIKTDYKILNVALHHILNNAVKYIMPYSYLSISFDNDTKTLTFEMISLRIEPYELDKIFEFKYRGKNVKKIDAGEGIGMYMVKKALNLVGAKILINPDYDKEQADVYNNKYVLNKFLIIFQ